MKKLFLITLLTAAGALSLRAQDKAPDKMTVPFTSATGRKLEINIPRGNITIRAYDGQEAVIESDGSTGRALRSKQKEPPPGMHRIENPNAPRVSTQNNTLKIDMGMWPSGGNLTIQVPAQTAVNVTTMSGQIHIENMAGEIEASSMNGRVTVENASGPVVANSMNGKIQVSLNNVMPDKAMSFSTMNGDIEVALPASIKANVRMRTNRGSMFTDFDFQTQRESREQGREQSTVGAINGGGPEIRFMTNNGDIVMRKK
jgi:DUF4097 and DUF4098 domain-containing protein YvlB